MTKQYYFKSNVYFRKTLSSFSVDVRYGTEGERNWQRARTYGALVLLRRTFFCVRHDEYHHSLGQCDTFLFRETTEMNVSKAYNSKSNTSPFSVFAPLDKTSGPAEGTDTIFTGQNQYFSLSVVDKNYFQQNDLISAYIEADNAKTK